MELFLLMDPKVRNNMIIQIKQLKAVICAVAPLITACLKFIDGRDPDDFDQMVKERAALKASMPAGLKHLLADIVKEGTHENT